MSKYLVGVRGAHHETWEQAGRGNGPGQTDLHTEALDLTLAGGGGWGVCWDWQQLNFRLFLVPAPIQAMGTCPLAQLHFCRLWPRVLGGVARRVTRSHMGPSCPAQGWVGGHCSISSAT